VAPNVLVPTASMHADDGQMIRAAGGILWRSPRRGTVEVALVHRPKYDDWSLPKGKLRRGEHPLVTACREVAEETGVHAVAGKRLDIEHYDTAAGPKAVEYWAMQGPDAPFTPTAEVDRLAWLPPADARRRLDYHRDAYAIDALEVLADGDLADAAVLLVRNGRTGPRTRWAGSEDDRPLDSKGEEQAEALRRTLPAFGPSRLLTAGGTRFADTMRPLGADLGLTVENEPTLGEHEYAAHSGRGLTRILEIAEMSGTTAVCAAGAVIRHILAALADDADLALGECPTRKGSVWALFFSGGQLAAADYYPALTSPRH
jgi:8-oxo-(d)GTP phosphatase